MSLDDVSKATNGWHEHGVNVYFAKEWHRSVDGGWDVNFCCLPELALVACFDIPFDILLKGWPPKSVQECVTGGVKAFVP